ncbi:hypothetical protein [Paenibacillus sp. HJGM_3]|uniref:hypothetical protein n=1 Tax=Paenibacillus sp. HJGM_3 TaxID=3379816 RepID=UPI00385DF722
MGTDKPTTNAKRHLLQVEVLLEDSSHALAIASLMQLLHHPKVKDFRITGGMELGKLIDEALLQSTAAPITASFPISKPTTPIEPGAAPSSAQSKPKADDRQQLRLELLEEYKERGTLVRLTVVKGKGIKLSMPCRILNFDLSDQRLTIYHVDEKKVYSFKLNEIDDIEAHTP